jgi:dienelactone hydrolase
MRLRNLVILAVAVVVLTACGPFLARPDVPAPQRYVDQVFANVTKNADISYGSAPDNNGNPVDLLLDLYQPAGDSTTARPAVIWIHGGSFSTGSKSDGYIVDLSTDYAERGYVAVSLDYRLLAPPGCGGNATPPPGCNTASLGAQQDAEAAIRFLRLHAAEYRIDPNRIAVAGASAGAIVADLVALFSENVGNSGNPGPPSNADAAVGISGGLPSGVTAGLAGPGDAPILEFHGTADDVVPYAWATDMVAAAQAAGVTAQLETLLDAGHVPYAQWSTVFKQQTAYFLYQQMDLAHAST